MMEAILERIAYVVLGWLLGVAGTLLVDHMRRRREAEQLRSGVFLELAALRYRLAHLAYALALRSGHLNHQRLEALRAPLELGQQVAEPTRLLEAVTALLASPPDQLDQKLGALRAGPREGLTPRTYQLPYLEANLGSIARTPSLPRRELLEIREQLSLLNQTMGELRELNALTFNDFNPDNLDATRSNISGAYENILRRCEIIEAIAARLHAG